MSARRETLRIDVVSDVVCPWCFIGKRHLDRALDLWRAESPDCAVAVRWQPFFLDPDTPECGEPYRPYLEQKFGGPEKLAEIWQRISQAGRKAGIEFAFEKIELRANTLHAHRLIHYAQKVGAGGTAIGGLIEGLFVTQFIAGRYIGDRAVLATVAGECGLDREAVQRYLATDEDTAEVQANAAAAQRQGVNGVPFFIFNNRLAVAGAQAPEALLQAMREAREPPRP
jgi:predicted DsbA family dithiol-disulfide isomerase